MIPFLATVGGGIAEGLQKYRQNKIDEQKRRIDEMLANAQMTDLTEGRRQRQEQLDLLKAGEARDADKYGRQPFLDSAATGQDVELSPEVQAKYPGLRMQTAALAGERTRADQQAMDTELHAGIERGMRAEESAAQTARYEMDTEAKRVELDAFKNPQNYPQLQKAGADAGVSMALKTLGYNEQDFDVLLTMPDEELQTFLASLKDTVIDDTKALAAVGLLEQRLKLMRMAMQPQTPEQPALTTPQVTPPAPATPPDLGALSSYGGNATKPPAQFNSMIDLIRAATQQDTTGRGRMQPPRYKR